MEQKRKQNPADTDDGVVMCRVGGMEVGEGMGGNGDGKG